MIRFGLVCGQGHEFEGWFRNGESFESQAASGDLSCPTCGDSSVQKAVMAPAVARSSRAEVLPPDPRRLALAQMMQMARKVQEHVEKNFDNVGERFPEEARRIHYGDAEHRDIYGKATGEEAQALRDEGIGISQLPMLPKLDG
ncbi:MAG TPA: DUF1178 family protein [Geminicoccaceae bacterium]|nr:DUF1178 family protein [Geminicoccus sp.]HMU50687.1 DUF1178 family protein [Geminicoccaceae bacterium]